jgi:hypothetical protein
MDGYASAAITSASYSWSTTGYAAAPEAVVAFNTSFAQDDQARGQAVGYLLALFAIVKLSGNSNKRSCVQ